MRSITYERVSVEGKNNAMGYNERGLTDQLKDRLSDEMQDELIHQGIQKQVSALINNCLGIDGRLEERSMGRKKIYHDSFILHLPTHTR